MFLLQRYLGNTWGDSAMDVPTGQDMHLGKVQRAGRELVSNRAVSRMGQHLPKTDIWIFHARHLN